MNYEDSTGSDRSAEVTVDQSMDQKLVDRCMHYHGAVLVDRLAEEQVQVKLPHFLALSQMGTAHYDRPRDKEFEDKIASFISRKADLLFSRREEVAVVVEEFSQGDKGYFAVLPPLEAIMEVPDEDKRNHFFAGLEKGDIVIGTITAVQESGLTVTLLSMDNSKSRDIQYLKITCFCPIKEVPRIYAHEPALEAYAIKDKVRGVLLNVVPENEKIIISMKTDVLPPTAQHFKLGLIPDEDFPETFNVLQRLTSKTYKEHLRSSVGFTNPCNVSTLTNMLGVDQEQTFSLLRTLARLKLQPSEYADALRKKQSYRWAIKNVEAGVRMFKEGQHTEAMQQLNKALQIDAENVEALVARGCLYANNESYARALDDFESALQINPRHVNAKKYMCETLLAHSRSFIDQEKPETAIQYLEKVLELEPGRSEAQKWLTEIHQNQAAKQRLDFETEKTSRRKSDDVIILDPNKSGFEKTSETLRKLIEEDKELSRHKRKRKRRRSSPEEHSAADVVWVEAGNKSEKKMDHSMKRERADMSHQSRRSRERSGDERLRADDSERQYHSEHHTSKSASRSPQGKRRSPARKSYPEDRYTPPSPRQQPSPVESDYRSHSRRSFSPPDKKIPKQLHADDHYHDDAEEMKQFHENSEYYRKSGSYKQEESVHNEEDYGYYDLEAKIMKYKEMEAQHVNIHDIDYEDSKQSQAKYSKSPQASASERGGISHDTERHHRRYEQPGENLFIRVANSGREIKELDDKSTKGDRAHDVESKSYEPLHDRERGDRYYSHHSSQDSYERSFKKMDHESSHATYGRRKSGQYKPEYESDRRSGDHMHNPKWSRREERPSPDRYSKERPDTNYRKPEEKSDIPKDGNGGSSNIDTESKPNIKEDSGTKMKKETSSSRKKDESVPPKKTIKSSKKEHAKKESSSSSSSSSSSDSSSDSDDDSRNKKKKKVDYKEKKKSSTRANKKSHSKKDKKVVTSEYKQATSLETEIYLRVKSKWDSPNDRKFDSKKEHRRSDSTTFQKSASNRFGFDRRKSDSTYQQKAFYQYKANKEEVLKTSETRKDHSTEKQASSNPLVPRSTKNETLEDLEKFYDMLKQKKKQGSDGSKI